jgi:hypothetical protein
MRLSADDPGADWSLRVFEAKENLEDSKALRIDAAHQIRELRKVQRLRTVA